MIAVAVLTFYLAMDKRAFLAVDSKTSLAEITKVNARRDSDHNTYYNVEYKFSAGGKTYSGSSNYGKTQPATGLKININYLEYSPEINSYSYTWMHLAMSSLYLVVSCIYFYGFLKQIFAGSRQT
jgi:hemolysin activation/secretion protein